MTTAQEEQLSKWVLGVSEHNDADGECCPDFSCCNKKIDPTPIATRERFAKACKTGDDNAKRALLGSFLGAAMSTMHVRAHITGDGAKHE